MRYKELYFRKSELPNLYTIPGTCTGIQALNNSHYGKPRKPVHLSNVHCSGSEEQLLSCKYTEFTSLDKKKEALKESDVAGVICQPSTFDNPTSSSTPSGHIPTTAPIDQSTDSFLDDANPLVIPLYVIALVLIVGLALVAITALV